MADNTPSFAQAEPVILADAIKGLLISVLALLQVFGLDITPEQSGAILLVFVAASVLFTVWTRSKTTPTPAVRGDDAGAFDCGDLVLALICFAIGFLVARVV